VPKLRLTATGSADGAAEREPGSGRELPLNELSAGAAATVVSINSRRSARMARLSAFGLLPGSRLHLLQRHPALVVKVGETEVALEAAVAREITVRCSHD
jgi:Fe2+ transport system protein FeoA